jgi:hypothetical protein
VFVLDNGSADYNRWVLLHKIKESHLAGRGYSLVRIGDGEGRIIACDKFQAEELYEQLLSYQFGVSLSSLKGRFGVDDNNSAINCAVRELRTALFSAMTSADCLGVFCEKTYTRSLESPDLAGRRALEESAKLFEKFIKEDVLLVSTYLFSNDVAFSQRFFKDLFAIPFRKIFILSSYESLSRVLESCFRREIEVIKTPSHATWGLKGGSYPSFFDKINNSEFVFPERSLVLSACGLVGKTLAARVRSQASVFLDIGGIVDGWIGAGHPYLKDQVAFRLIK